MSSKEIKEKIIKDIEKLPKSSLKQILDLISSRLLKEDASQKDQMQNEEQLDPSRDPLLKYIGSITNGSLAQDIDSTLYGNIR